MFYDSWKKGNLVIARFNNGLSFVGVIGNNKDSKFLKLIKPLKLVEVQEDPEYDALYICTHNHKSSDFLVFKKEDLFLLVEPATHITTGYIKMSKSIDDETRTEKKSLNEKVSEDLTTINKIFDNMDIMVPLNLRKYN